LAASAWGDAANGNEMTVKAGTTETPTVTVSGDYVQVTSVHRIAAPARAVWGAVGDWSNSAIGKDFVERAVISGAGVGATRIFFLPARAGGGSVTERLDAMDNARMTYTYRLVDPGPLPVSDYSGDWAVRSTGPAAAEITFHCRFIPRGIDPQKAADIFIGNQDHVFSRLDEIFQDGGHSHE
jgi:hypothetical protein